MHFRPPAPSNLKQIAKILKDYEIKRGCSDKQLAAIDLLAKTMRPEDVMQAIRNKQLSRQSVTAHDRPLLRNLRN